MRIGKKINYQHFDQESKSRDIRRIVEILIDAKILLACYHCEASGVHLEATKDDNVYKLYFVDIGLLNCIHKLGLSTLEDEFKRNFVTKGVIAEQFVAQHLCAFEGRSKSPSLNYWLRDKGSQKGEIDFLIEHESRIFPIEVKASTRGHLKSLFYFAGEKKSSEVLSCLCPNIREPQLNIKSTDHSSKST